MNESKIILAIVISLILGLISWYILQMFTWVTTCNEGIYGICSTYEAMNSPVALIIISGLYFLVGLSRFGVKKSKK